ncbi:hypothetical protein [Arthrobacter sp.]|uniref:hypothetical protein n=1 Tax=Arthrobacter sp. TaxID=1667 RepID=UPI003A8F69F4
MPLPELKPEPASHFAANFQVPHLVESNALVPENRIACLSQIGVNLLLQRWVHHNSRVIVPTFDYQEVTAEQFEEADLVEEWCEDLAASPDEVETETEAAHEWLRSASSEQNMSWQKLLKNPQSRGAVRSAMRKQIRKLQNSR